MKDDRGNWIKATDIYFFLRRDDGKYAKFKIERFIVHPKHNDLNRSGFDYAIAILSLDSEVEYSHLNTKNYATSE